MMHRVGGSLSF